MMATILISMMIMVIKSMIIMRLTDVLITESSINIEQTVLSGNCEHVNLLCWPLVWWKSCSFSMSTITKEGNPKGIIGRPCPKLSWTICLVLGSETLNITKIKTQYDCYGNDNKGCKYDWNKWLVQKGLVKHLQIEADLGRLEGEQGGGSWSSSLPAILKTWNKFHWFLL